MTHRHIEWNENIWQNINQGNCSNPLCSLNWCINQHISTCFKHNVNFYDPLKRYIIYTAQTHSYYAFVQGFFHILSASTTSITANSFFFFFCFFLWLLFFTHRFDTNIKPIYSFVECRFSISSQFNSSSAAAMFFAFALSYSSFGFHVYIIFLLIGAVRIVVEWLICHSNCYYLGFF